MAQRISGSVSFDEEFAQFMAAREEAKKIKKEEEEEEEEEDKKRKPKDQGGRDAVKCYHCQRIGHKAHECYERENQRQADRVDGFNLAYVTINPCLDALDLGLAAEQKKTKDAEKRAEKAEKKVKEQGEKIAYIEYFLRKLPARLTTE
ncbi:hypothetical protein FVEN_g10968 [Fusarium venenatum]|uniref:CCHC-type domain-containing protein n=1 Tax=Fusarium venenatum TaxID=56646 RepID=A0A2L2T8H0_9HYPO|nr:uncharacterized protein FVRRES_03706 [Fusarium venenatum]KAG8350845.1 hypothetical protein FVEN_g10968 [Fusarium venenatum]KAH7003288.1 hypothetical protein EDB82DRAFT_519339 [Fusarium venenatum]CEI67194.1 unnamed protein product [Fusarium venenatum]